MLRANVVIDKRDYKFKKEVAPRWNIKNLKDELKSSSMDWKQQLNIFQLNSTYFRFHLNQQSVIPRYEFLSKGDIELLKLKRVNSIKGLHKFVFLSMSNLQYKYIYINDSHSITCVSYFYKAPLV